MRYVESRSTERSPTASVDLAPWLNEADTAIAVSGWLNEVQAEQDANWHLDLWLNEAQADRQARWEGRLLRGRELRQELAEARRLGKAARHADRLRRIAAATREE